MRTILTTLGAAIVVSFLSLVSPVKAGPVFPATLNIKCVDRATAQAQLQAFDEAPVGLGIIHDDQIVFELWLSPDSSTWTFTMTDGKGITCAVGNGKDWISLTPTSKKDPISFL